MLFKFTALSFLFFIPFLGIKNGSSKEGIHSFVETTYVYICSSSSSKKYHYTKTCRGLNRCSHEIKKITLSDAQSKYGRTLCGWED